MSREIVTRRVGGRAGTKFSARLIPWDGPAAYGCKLRLPLSMAFGRRHLCGSARACATLRVR